MKKSRNGTRLWNKNEKISLRNDEEKFKKLFD